MINSIIIQKPIVKLGCSHYLLIDKDTMAQLELSEGQIMKIKINKLVVKEVVCPKCTHAFEDAEENDPHDCPSCGEEFLDVDNLNADIAEEEKLN